MEIRFLPLTADKISTYLSVGIQSYREHYLHLWKNSDPKSFIEENLTHDVVQKSINDPNQKLFLIELGESAIGILKLTLDYDHGEKLPVKNILLNKIYLLKKWAGKGYGKKALDFVENWAIENQRKTILLFAMKKGDALRFYLKKDFVIKGDKNIALSGILDSEKAMWLLVKTL